MQAQWQAEKEALWKAIRLEVMQEILEDPCVSTGAHPPVADLSASPASHVTN